MHFTFTSTALLSMLTGVDVGKLNVHGIKCNVYFFYRGPIKSDDQPSRSTSHLFSPSNAILESRVISSIPIHFVMLPIWCLKPASHYKLIRRFRGSCRDFRLTTGTLRLADAHAQTDNWIGDPSAKTKPATHFPDHCMTNKCPACDNILNFRPILYVNKTHHYPL